jgi:ATP-dependent helicase HepA
MTSFTKGQRWISESEPELGLATVVDTTDGRVQVVFPATGETRMYASDNAPLKRVRFRIGDTVESHEGDSHTITAVTENSGLITYLSAEGELPEALLSDNISLHGPEDRLFATRFDENRDFDLRLRTLHLQNLSKKSPVRGFVGGRIDLIPHQLYIAQEVASRQAPRVMLSDEVGLGKTIEACLILHRLILTGRAGRILVIVPESLVHQWFVEMLRRFNVWLHIFDEERCESIEAGDPGTNPFLDDQLIIASIDFLAASKKRAQQVVDAEWDVLVVDEAHHLEWSPDAPSHEYQLVEALSRRAEGLLLLTATPEQLGLESHFARLRLLDPDRYSDLESFQAESRDYEDTANVTDRLLHEKKLTKQDVALIQNLLGHDKELPERLQSVANGNGTARLELLDDLLDMHGPGRVLFRNTRAAMTGFPERCVNLVALNPESDKDEWLDNVSTEFAVDAGDSTLDTKLDLRRDPRIVWLSDQLQKLADQKVLLICRSLEKVTAIDNAIRHHLNIKIGVFHEDLSLVQRDRNAAWFADEDGARLLICSEIGSEGRNFQFAHHLVLFDLPLNPELLEQRIGRLDRIGQTEDIKIHVPFLTHSPQEVLAHWYHAGLDAFETNLEGGNELLKKFGQTVHDLALEFAVADRNEADAELEQLVADTAKERKRLRQILEQGRDRLLEMNSFRPATAHGVIDQIQTEDDSPVLEIYMLDVFDHFGVKIEETAPHTWQLNPQGIVTDSFPSMPEEGMVATCDRKRALGREDVGFLTWDHPMVGGAMELLLGSEKGNCAFGVMPTPDERTLLLEMVFVVEAIAPARLHVDRFLPSTPVRVVMNHKPSDVTGEFPAKAFACLQKGSPYKLLDNPDISRKLLPNMITAGNRTAAESMAKIVESSTGTMDQLLNHEIHRLTTLKQVNNNVRQEEIDLAEEQKDELTKVIENARLRLDAIRLIWKGPAEVLGG